MSFKLREFLALKIFEYVPMARSENSTGLGLHRLRGTLDFASQTIHPFLNLHISKRTHVVLGCVGQRGYYFAQDFWEGWSSNRVLHSILLLKFQWIEYIARDYAATRASVLQQGLEECKDGGLGEQRG